MATWTPVVLLPFATFRPKMVWRAASLVSIIWLVAVSEVGEPSWRLVLPHSSDKEGIRIVSLNCAGGTAEAAAEAFDLNADIVLLQEVASRPEFDRVAMPQGYVCVAFGPDAALYVVKGLNFRNPNKSIDSASAEVILDGRPFRIMSLRLLPPVFRLDWYSKECWTNYTEDLHRREARIRELTAANVEDYLFGGDFNSTNPKIGGQVNGATEAHRSVGSGWGGTGTNDFPMVRVDQIWGSRTIRWRQAYVERTRNSDHRMVIADFQVLSL